MPYFVRYIGIISFINRSFCSVENFPLVSKYKAVCKIIYELLTYYE